MKWPNNELNQRQITFIKGEKIGERVAMQIFKFKNEIFIRCKGYFNLCGNCSFFAEMWHQKVNSCSFHATIYHAPKNVKRC